MNRSKVPPVFEKLARLHGFSEERQQRIARLSDIDAAIADGYVREVTR